MALVGRIDCSNATLVYVIRSTSFVLSGGKSQRFSLQHDPFPIKSLQSKSVAQLCIVHFILFFAPYRVEWIAGIFCLLIDSLPHTYLVQPQAMSIVAHTLSVINRCC